ncbi:O-acetylhomoserine [Penicillium chrysogenum]|uniref:Pc23g00630 protein n=4 Tax=Penicillium TaxID=5073 RepID=B6HWB3_PENRW|nr:O-acetylhomoserine [Penicillium chrysogenum]CAP79557.1 Pc23g00630 [Penicillium rubens Wisconsin 54-1255]CDM32815.1 Cys/Met metabolism, pyridoxal phosphate-dependent enzyme [Penicillium roqueforti FM164]CRL31535.1 Cys/Met metabolism, pyridoxal phosphate-dependent enzyme [Penicillium camemberti]
MLEKPALQRFETLQLHAGAFPDALNSCSVPIYTTAAFGFNNAEHGVRLLNVSEFGNIYSRITNPTVSVFQNRMAALEGGVAACAVASGSAAVSMTLMALAGIGDNIVASFHVHGGTLHQFKVLAPQLGIESRFVTSNDPEDFRSKIDEKTKFIFVESISNPKYVVPDLEALAKIAHSKGIPLIVDNTFGCAGYFCRPIDHGADIVLHSATKWICGHGTTLGGVIIDAGTFDWGAQDDKFPQFHVNGAEEGSGELSLWNMFGSRAFAIRCQFEVLRDIGSSMSPQAAQQLIIGLESLAVRCDRHTSNTRALATWLEQQPSVAWVRYLGNEDHPSHKNAERYLHRGYGGVFSFGIKGGKQAGFKLCDGLKLIINTANLGDSKTLVVHPWTTTHQQLTDAERLDAGVDEDHMRLSVGIEHIDDLKDDFCQAFASMNETTKASANSVKQNSHIEEQKRMVRTLFGSRDPLPLSVPS